MHAIASTYTQKEREAIARDAQFDTAAAAEGQSSIKAGTRANAHATGPQVTIASELPYIAAEA